MAWRVLSDGPMIEVSGGITDDSKREITQVIVGRAGQVIEKDLSKSMRDRYEAQDPYMRSIVEYGEIELHDIDGEDEPQRVFVPKGIQVDGGDTPQTDEALVASNTELGSRVTELQSESAQKDNRIAELEGQLSDAQAVNGESSTQVEALQQQLSDANAQIADLQQQLEDATAPPETPEGESETPADQGGSGS